MDRCDGGRGRGRPALRCDLWREALALFLAMAFALPVPLLGTVGPFSYGALRAGLSIRRKMLRVVLPSRSLPSLTLLLWPS